MNIFLSNFLYGFYVDSYIAYLTPTGHIGLKKVGIWKWKLEKFRELKYINIVFFGQIHLRQFL